MENRYRYLIKNAGILTIGNFSSKVLIFLLVPLYTSVLSTEEYGFFDLISATVTLMLPILSLNISDGVMRFAMDKRISKSEVVTIGMKYTGISILLFGVFVFINEYFSIWTELSEYKYYVFLYYIFYVINQFMMQTAKGLEYVKDMAAAGVLGTAVTVFCNILFLLVFPLKLRGFYLAYILGQAVPMCFLAVRLKVHQYIQLRINRELQKEILIYSAPLIMNSLGWWANNASDRYVVTWMCGIAVNGLYSVAYKIPSILNTIQSIFTQAWQISAIKEADKEDSKIFFSRIFVSVNMAVCIVCTLIIIFTRPLACILYAKDFYQAWYYVPFLLVSIVMNGASGIIGPILAANKNSKAMGMSALYGSVLNIILNVVLVYMMGAQGAAIATAVSSGVIYVLRKRAVGDIIVSKEYRKVLFSWFLLVMQATIMIYVQQEIWQLLIIAMIVFIYRYEIKAIVVKGIQIKNRHQ